jgi:hypothetical protein
MDFKCYHYDIGRGAYLKPDVFKSALVRAADSGFTHFLPYLENMIRLPSFEKACPESAYTPDQWRSFDETAGERGIELIPHFNVIGHSKDACAAYPELAGGKGGFELDVESDRVKEWTKRCLEEFCGFSTGKHFLIGGDEWQTPNHLLVDPDFNVARAWANHVNLAVDVLKRHDRIPIVWHDMLLHYPEALKLLDKSAVIAFWFYDEDSDYPAIDMFQSMGFKTIMASGICNGNLSRRRVSAIERAVEASAKHAAYGTMVTSWSDGRWEKQKLNISFCGELLKGGKVSDEIINVISVFDMMGGVLDVHPGGDELLADSLEVIRAGAFDGFPDYKQLLLNLAERNVDAELDSYLRHHYDEGPMMLAIKGLCPHGDISMVDVEAAKKPKFEYAVTDKSFGPAIKLANGEESFVIYPKYGATLQNYRLGDETIIPHSLPEFIEKNTFEPGGYRSYSGAGGFRPIWAFGSHHNPCVVWQGPFEWNVDSNDREIRVELARKMPHVDLNYTIVVEKGKRGFTFTARAVNKIDGAYGTFSFNLPLALTSADFADLNFEWENGGALPFRDIRDTFVVIPAKRCLTVSKPGVVFAIESDPELTAGYYTDMSLTCVTPDLRGYYQKLGAGDACSATWRFSANGKMV